MNPQETRQQAQTDAPRPEVETVIDRIAEDSRQDPEQFLNDTVVPHGGE